MNKLSFDYEPFLHPVLTWRYVATWLSACVCLALPHVCVRKMGGPVCSRCRLQMNGEARWTH